MADDALPGLPSQPADVAWPEQAWPRGKTGEHVDVAKLNALLAGRFHAAQPQDIGETHALIVVQRGRMVLEHYAPGFDAQTTYRSWSVAKSITHALVGILIRMGRISLDDPVMAPEWRSPGDPRQHITLDHLLRMSSGLAFVEDYEDDEVSDVLEMLYGPGRPDVGAYAAQKALIHPPGRVCSYSSGTTNIISRFLAKALGEAGAVFEAFMRDELFGPIGIHSARPKFDAAGTFIGSSFCFCTAEDFARFGLLYLRDGVWNGRRLLPEGWVDHARTPGPAQPEEGLAYGGHWWLGLGGSGSFSANGYQGQFILLVPQDDLIIVRHGASPLAATEALRDWMGQLAACFRT